MDNKLNRKLAADALVCAPQLETECHVVYSWVRKMVNATYASGKDVNHIVRGAKFVAMLRNVIAYGLGYIDVATLKQAYYDFEADDRRYWDYGELRTQYLFAMDNTYAHPAIRYPRLLPLN